MKNHHKKPSKVSRDKASMLFTKSVFKDLLQLNEDEYHAMRREVALHFLSIHFPLETPYGRYWMICARDKNYWNWWNLNWAKIQSFFNHKYIERCIPHQNKVSTVLFSIPSQFHADLNDSFHHNYIKKFKNHVQ